MGPLVEPVASGSAGGPTRTLAATRHGGLASTVTRSAHRASVRRPRRPTPAPGHRPHLRDQPPPAGDRSSACLLGNSMANSQRQRHHHRHRPLLGRCAPARRPRHLHIGKPKSHWAISPAAYAVRRPDPAADTPAAARPPRRRAPESTVQPIRSAITVAGMRGYPCSSSRIRGSTSSTIEPIGRR